MYITHASRREVAFETREDLRVEDIIRLSSALVPRLVGAHALGPEGVDDFCRRGKDAHDGALSS